jgi:hypothetical protein
MSRWSTCADPYFQSQEKLECLLSTDSSCAVIVVMQRPYYNHKSGFDAIPVEVLISIDAIDPP